MDRHVFGRLAATITLILLVSACGTSGSASSASTASTASVDAVPSATRSVDPVPSDADPALAAIYNDFVREEMPGVPFDLLSAAQEEGTVVWYHGQLTEANNETISQFQERFPFITVEELTMNSPALLERFLTESRAGLHAADIMTGTSPSEFEAAAEEGFLDSYRVSSESELPDGTYTSGVW